MGIFEMQKGEGHLNFSSDSSGACPSSSIYNSDFTRLTALKNEF